MKNYVCSVYNWSLVKNTCILVMVIKRTSGLYTFHWGYSLILSLLTTLNSKHLPFFLENSSIYLLIFGCAGSSPLRAAVSVVAVQGFSLQSRGSRVRGLQQFWDSNLVASWRVDLPGPGVEPVSPCTSRQILNNWTTRGVLSIFTLIFTLHLIPSFLQDCRRLFCPLSFFPVSFMSMLIWFCCIKRHELSFAWSNLLEAFHTLALAHGVYKLDAHLSNNQEIAILWIHLLLGGLWKSDLFLSFYCYHLFSLRFHIFGHFSCIVITSASYFLDRKWLPLAWFSL